MNKMHMSLVVAAVAVLGMLRVEAVEITFTGADAANPTNLSSSANWSATPGAGTIGVIGPTRMQYGKVMSVLEFIKKGLGEILAGQTEEE